MHRPIGVALGVPVLWLVAGCSALPPLPDFGFPSARQTSPVTSPFAQPMGVQTGVIEVVNTTDAPLDMVRISACGQPTDARNRLAGIVIAPAASRQFDISAGCWDVDAGATGVGEARQRLTVHADAISRYTVTG